MSSRSVGDSPLSPPALQKASFGHCRDAPIRMDCADRRKTLPFLFLAMLQLWSVGDAAHAAVVDDFEGPQVSWMRNETDAGFQLVRHQRVQNDAHSGQSSELIQITGQTGS